VKRLQAGEKDFLGWDDVGDPMPSSPSGT